MRTAVLTVLAACIVQHSLAKKSIDHVARDWIGVTNSRCHCVFSVSGGAVSTDPSSAAAGVAPSNVQLVSCARTSTPTSTDSSIITETGYFRPAHVRRIAWSLPWSTVRRKGRRRAKRDSRGKDSHSKSTVGIGPQQAAKMGPSSVAFSGALASFIGAMIVSGGTLAMWPQMAVASPFDPRPPPKSSRQPFFEGWFIRLVDHEQRLSFAVIFGSFRSRGVEGSELDQHYVSLSYLHEPKGGILPAEPEEDEEAEESLDSSDDDNIADLTPGKNDAMSLSPQARLSMMAERFKVWMKGRRHAALRGFGANLREDDASETTGTPGGDSVSVEPDSISEDGEVTGAGINGNEDAGKVDGHRPLGVYDEGGVETGGAEPLSQGKLGEDVPKQEEGGEELSSDEQRYDDLRGGSMEPPQKPLIDGREDVTEEADEFREDSGDKIVDVDDTDDAAGVVYSEGEKEWTNDSPEEEKLSRVPLPVKERPLEEALWLPPALPQQPQEPPERTHTFHSFPPPETVTILCKGEPVESVPNLRDDPNFTWEADGVGSFMVDGDTGRLSFQLPELSVAASFRHRLPWSEERPNSAGPEGWLQRTGLLPTHYFVHSMGSEAGYSLKAADAPRAVVGRGTIHMEANYGESFPTGWVWAQGASATSGLNGQVFRDGESPKEGSPDVGGGNSGAEDGLEAGTTEHANEKEEPARFVLTGGKFVIGPITTNSFVVAFRSSKHRWNFRTTDLDRISMKASRKENRLSLVARSWGSERVLEVDIKAPEGSFGSAIYVPTPDGFSNKPGCVESYAATATFRLYTKGGPDSTGVGRPLVLREEVEFKLAALEFGGEFQDT